MPGKLDEIYVKTLIVDDDPEHAEVFCDLISDLKLTISIANSGQEALSLLQKQKFQIVLTDLIMPGMNGMELMHQILVHHPAMIVIMITGSGDLQGAVRAMQLGAFSYFSKTGEPEDLRKEIRKAMEIINLRKQVAQHVPAKLALPLSDHNNSTAPPVSLKQARRMAEAVHIRNVLIQVSGNKTQAASILGITYRQLLNRLKDLEL
ncbi:response regulator [Desulfonatronovibrio magnus]|uniref:response regulator n=1 Tax=Desulfonatronovibrio magnus TaxID=698827 RepID=UPI0005EB86E7|nr:DNA-binding response regulator [Desulfonatronovibrio magnus]